MRTATLCFALTLTLLGASAYADSTDENKYICIDPSKFNPSTTWTNPDGGGTKTCDQWIDVGQGSGQVFDGITFNSTFSAAAQTTAVQDGLKMYARVESGLACCSDEKSAAWKNYTYFCKDPNAWLPDKTYTPPGKSAFTCTFWLESDAHDRIKAQDFTKAWSCDGKSEEIQQDVQGTGAEHMGCCGTDKKSACWIPPPPPAPSPPPPGQFVDNAPDGACCVASWGSSNADCTNCYSRPGFTCRDSHQPGSVDPAGKDCISFEYATEAACTAAGFKWAPSLNMFCARNDTQHLARSGALGPNGKGAATLAIVSALTALALALT